MDIGRTLSADVTGDLLGEVVGYKALYEALFRLAQNGMAELDANGIVQRWNLSAEAFTGYAYEHVIGRPLQEIVTPETYAAIIGVAPDGQPHEMRCTLIDQHGKQRAFRAYVLVIKEGADVQTRLFTLLPGRAADEIEQLKNEFVSTVSHELKTPLAAIKAYSETMLANPAATQEQRRDYLEIINQQADRLERLIDDLLLVSRVEAGQMLKRRVKIKLAHILERVVLELPYDRDRYRITHDTGDVVVSGDPDRLVDVFVHLLDNAIKYTPQGGEVRVDAQELNGHTIVTVRDFGIGMEEEHLPFIFDRFYRIESDLTSSVGGSGIGLFLVHALLRAHGGNVEVRSEPGKGSAFTLRLPVRD